jgi:hypothetical protein
MEHKKEILIVAASHLHRVPDYWSDRESKHNELG